MGLSEWNQVGAYNLGTFVTGAITFVLGSRGAVAAVSRIAAGLAVAFALLGLYIAYRGIFWYIADGMAEPDEDYHPWFKAQRWTIWLFIVPMELVLFWVYMKIFGDKRIVEALIIGLVLAAYLVGGFVSIRGN